MPTCDYVKIFFVKDDDGKTEEIKDRCINKQNVREIEFKHAEYREQNKIAFLCDTHFGEVFGDIDEEEKKALRDWQNAKYHYNRDYATAKKMAEYFEESQFKEHNYPKVQKLYEKWANVRKRVCRYEHCEKKLAEVRRVFVVRVYSQKGTEWANYYFCCKEHWEKMKFRIGIELPSHLQKKPVKVATLDDYK